MHCERIWCVNEALEKVGCSLQLQRKGFSDPSVKKVTKYALSDSTPLLWNRMFWLFAEHPDPVLCLPHLTRLENMYKVLKQNTKYLFLFLMMLCHVTDVCSSIKSCVRAGLGYHWRRADRVLAWTLKLKETWYQFNFKAYWQIKSQVWRENIQF